MFSILSEGDRIFYLKFAWNKTNEMHYISVHNFFSIFTNQNAYKKHDLWEIPSVCLQVIVLNETTLQVLLTDLFLIDVFEMT